MSYNNVNGFIRTIVHDLSNLGLKLSGPVALLVLILAFLPSHQIPRSV